MLQIFIYLATIGTISCLYNLHIYPIIISNIDLLFYNNFIISLLILIQVDNFILYYDNKGGGE